jgi:hypothetical protein
MNNRTRIKLSNTALEACRDLIGSNEYYDIYAYINDHNEWGLGVEILVDIICEEHDAVSVSQCDKIVVALESMGLGKSKHLHFFKQHTKNT